MSSHQHIRQFAESGHTDRGVLSYDIHGALRISADSSLRGAFYFLGAPAKQHDSRQDCIVSCISGSVSEPAKASVFYGDCFGEMDQEEVFLSRSLLGIKMQLCLRNLAERGTEMTVNESYWRFGDTALAMGLRPPWCTSEI